MAKGAEVQTRVVMKRPDGWYSADNEMIDLAAEIGVEGFAVYHLLKSMAWKDAPKVGLREIAATFGMGKTRAATAVKKLVAAGLLKVIAATSVNEPQTYVVEHAKDVVSARVGGTKPAALACLKSGPRRVSNQAHGVSHAEDTGGSETRHQRLATGTPNKEEVQTQKTKASPLPPASGGLKQERPPRRLSAAEVAAATRASVGMVAAPVLVRERVGSLTSADLRAAVRTALGEIEGELEDLAREMGCTPGGAVPNPAEQFKALFAGVEYDSHEAMEGQAGGLLLRLACDDPRETLKGVKTYDVRLQRALARACGRQVSVQVIAKDAAAA